MVNLLVLQSFLFVILCNSLYRVLLRSIFNVRGARAWAAETGMRTLESTGVTIMDARAVPWSITRTPGSGIGWTTP